MASFRIVIIVVLCALVRRNVSSTSKFSGAASVVADTEHWMAESGAIDAVAIQLRLKTEDETRKAKIVELLVLTGQDTASLADFEFMW
jgi:hypothetical protein